MVTINEVFQSLWWLGWSLAVISCGAFVLTAMVLRRAELDLDAAEKEGQSQEREITNLTTTSQSQQREITNLNRENDQLCADNMALEQRNKMLVERLAAVEPKAQELDKMAERQAIVQAAYDHYGQRAKCPVVTHCKRMDHGVTSWPIHLN